jgi:hypothetical protein
VTLVLIVTLIHPIPSMSRKLEPLPSAISFTNRPQRLALFFMQRLFTNLRWMPKMLAEWDQVTLYEAVEMKYQRFTRRMRLCNLRKISASTFGWLHAVHPHIKQSSSSATEGTRLYPRLFSVMPLKLILNQAAQAMWLLQHLTDSTHTEGPVLCTHMFQSHTGRIFNCAKNFQTAF